MRIAQYIKDVVATRAVPSGRGPGAVVMKLDVEGGEMEIMADLIMSGALAHLDHIHVDWESLVLREEDMEKYDQDVELVNNYDVINFRSYMSLLSVKHKLRRILVIKVREEPL